MRRRELLVRIAELELTNRALAGEVARLTAASSLSQTIATGLLERSLARDFSEEAIRDRFRDYSSGLTVYGVGSSGTGVPFPLGTISGMGSGA